jgi:hypothetical protein
MCAAKRHVRFTPNNDIDCAFRQSAPQSASLALRALSQRNLMRPTSREGVSENQKSEGTRCRFGLLEYTAILLLMMRSFLGIVFGACSRNRRCSLSPFDQRATLLEVVANDLRRGHRRLGYVGEAGKLSVQTFPFTEQHIAHAL